MSLVQGVLEFSIELHKFFNIDLFQRGFYQVRLLLKVESQSAHKIEVSQSLSTRDDRHSYGLSKYNNTHDILPPCIIDGCAVSRTFKILYKNERIDLNNVVTYRTYLNLDPSRCYEQISSTEFILIVELWFSEQESPVQLPSLECVSSRELVMHVDLCRGLHYYRPVIFDYFHLSAITLSIHTALVALGKPFTRPKPKSNELSAESSNSITDKPSGYDLLIFDCKLATINEMDWSEMQLRLRRAQLIHWQLCSILFASINSLSKRFSRYRETADKESINNTSHRKSHNHSHSSQLGSIVPNSRSMSHLAQVCYQSSLNSGRNDFDLTSSKRDLIAFQNSQSSDVASASHTRPLEYVTMVESDFSYLSSLNRLLWDQFLKFTIGNNKISHHLAKKHHYQRIRRFSEGFFIVERTRNELKNNMDNNSTLFTSTADALRKSAYFQLLPYCDVECKSLDGDATTLPIIFEENFDPVNTSTSAVSVGDKSSPHQSLTKLIKKQSSNRNENLPNCNQITNSNSINESSGIGSDVSSVKSTAGQSTNDISSSSNNSSHSLHSIVKASSSSNALSNASEELSSLFEGTLYFPKPPGEFASGVPKTSTTQVLSTAKSTITTEQTSTSGEKSDNLSTNTSEDSVFESTAEAKTVQCNNTLVPSCSSTTTKTGQSEKLPPLTSNRAVTSASNDKSTLVSDELGKSDDEESFSGTLLTCRKSTISSNLVSFTEAKEEFRRTVTKEWNVYSDFNRFASQFPYLEFDSEVRGLTSPEQHLVVCVHGLDGNSADLRMVRTFLELGLPTCDLVFLMSQGNQGETFDCLDMLAERLAKEIIDFIQINHLRPGRLSFIGHSLGNIIIRSVLARPELKPLLPKLHTFLSLSAPHLGTLYNSSGLINVGLWLFQKWKKSTSLLQLCMKDHPDARQCFLYKLSQIKLDAFKYVVLFGSSQDNYVPIHSAHINPCSASLNDASPQGVAYREMIDNILKPIAENNSCQLIRLDVHHALASNTSALIGRAAHIAVLDSELFIEKFLTVCGLKYFT